MIEIKQLVNFIGRVKELYKIYKTTADWKVPEEVLAVIRKVPNLGKTHLPLLSGKGCVLCRCICCTGLWTCTIAL